ncbi:hypothetical protein EPN44_09620 [bacterium]|nr:MAG: hypothetical protein EPN44_09620 [bacterium]
MFTSAASTLPQTFQTSRDDASHQRKLRKADAMSNHTSHSALAHEHEEIHAALHRALELSGETGAAARALAELLKPHFEKEEQYVMPAVSVLGDVARGQVPDNMREIAASIEQLKAELSTMLSEHEAILHAADRLRIAANQEGQSEAAALAVNLKHHALVEEEVIYPAGVLVGEVLKCRA